MPGSYCLKDYEAALTELLKNLNPYVSYQFLGGHRKQGTGSEENSLVHTLTIQVVRNMIQLCEKMLQK